MEPLRARDLSQDTVTMVHTKLELNLQDTLSELELTLQMLDGMQDLNFSRIRQDYGHDRAAYVSKSPEDIITEFLTRVYRRVKEVVNEVLMASEGRFPITFVFTVPEVCQYNRLTILQQLILGIELVLRCHQLVVPRD